MKDIDKEAIKLKDLYLDTLEKCGTYLLKADDDTIEYNIFEEFDIGIHTFFYESNLELLYSNELISLEVRNKSQQLRDMAISIQKNGEWNITSFRNSKPWNELLVLADKIKKLEFNQRMGLDSINYLFISSEQMEFVIKMNKDIINEDGKKYLYKRDEDYWIELKFQDDYSLSIRVALCNPTDSVLIALDNLFLFLFGFKNGVLNDLKAKKSYNHYNDEIRKDIVYFFVKQKDIFKEMYGDYTAAISSDEFYKRQGY